MAGLNWESLGEVGKVIGAVLGVASGAMWGWGKVAARRRKMDLLEHPFFERISDVLLRHVRDLPIEDPMRKAAFQDLLAIKLRTWMTETEKFIRRTDFGALSDHQMRDALTSYLESTIALYEREAEESGIPPLLVSKFRVWHDDAVRITARYIKGVCDSDWLPDNQQRMVGFLFFLLGALEGTSVDAELTLADLNGELNGQVYKGLVARPYESPMRRRGSWTELARHRADALA